MRIDQLALLFALVIMANIVVLVALEVPSFRRLRRTTTREADHMIEMGTPSATAQFGETGPTPMEAGLYQRVVRVVSFLFIGSVLVIETLAGGQRIGVYVVCAVGVFAIVLLQDVLPAGRLGRWRLPLEAGSAVAFLTMLLILTGGQESAYFFGYILLLGAGSLWASGLGPVVLALVTSVSYLFAVVIASGRALENPEAIGRVAFNLVALALVTYIAAVIGREQRRAREEALRLSRFDPMTTLHSRSYYESAVEQEILRAARTGRGFALVMVDLDGLKAANDRFGHDSGDRLLKAVAEVMRGDIRATDVAARYGGDEFVMMLPETDLQGALRVADKVRVDISRLALPHNGSLIRTSASIGVVTFPDDGRTSVELMRRADLAMYEAKRRGRDQVVRYAREHGVPVESEVHGGPRGQAEWTHRTDLPPPRRDGTPPQPTGSPGYPPRTTAPAGVRAAPSSIDVPPESPFPAPWERR
ncbi:MAG TPA: diguanylate cyclase [Candidatus Limnocylindrales bacterium]|nr:diguanylate cyclase [Candidatus Limnocylindrales bacterium]